MFKSETFAGRGWLLCMGVIVGCKDWRDTITNAGFVDSNEVCLRDGAGVLAREFNVEEFPVLWVNGSWLLSW